MQGENIPEVLWWSLPRSLWACLSGQGHAAAVTARTAASSVQALVQSTAFEGLLSDSLDLRMDVTSLNKQQN